jgi:hypothetical protein
MNTRTSAEQSGDRLEAKAANPEDKLPTYQELLDEAVDETFPASDPVAPSAARRTKHAVSTAKDDQDWKLHAVDSSTPQAQQQVVAAFDDEAQARHARDEALQQALPSARLDVPAAHDGATLTVVALDDEQRRQAEAIAREAGASKVDVKQ